MGRFARYTAHADAVARLRPRLHGVIEAVAQILMDEVIVLISSSSPSGRLYPRPGGGLYRASAPGEPPAIRTGDYLRGFAVLEAYETGSTIISGVVNGVMAKEGMPLWVVLEFGHRGQLDLFSASAGLLLPRPHLRPAIDRATPDIRQFLHDVQGVDPGRLRVDVAFAA